MKKLLFVCVLVLAAASIFAQTAPAAAPTKYEIYGSTFFDYQMSGTEASMSTPLLSDFTFSKLRFGFKAQLADAVKSTFEIDPRNGEFRLAFIDWSVIPGLTLTIGKNFTFFEQIIPIYGGARNLYAGAKYSLQGIGWAGLQIGNKSDLGYLSGNYLIFPTPAAVKNASWNVQQDPWLYLWPAVVFKPDLGAFSLEVGLEGQLIPQQMGAPSNPMGASLDAYFTVGAFGFTFTNEFAWINANATNALQELTYYAQLTYNAGFVAPTVYIVTDTMNNFSNNPNTAIGIEVPFVVTGSFKINPLFSYAISNYNAFEGNYAIVNHLYNTNDWTIGIRFDYSYSVKF